MPVAASDVLMKLASSTGPGNSTAQANPNNSLGGFMSSTQITNATLNNLFDDVSGAENAASTVDYRCFFFHNSHATASMTISKIYISSETAGGASIAIGTDPVGVVSATSASAMAATIANETTAPAGVTFASPTTYAGSSIPSAGGVTIGPGQAIAVWVRRTAANTASLTPDGALPRIEFDTV